MAAVADGMGQLRNLLCGRFDCGVKEKMKVALAPFSIAHEADGWPTVLIRNQTCVENCLNKLLDHGSRKSEIELLFDAILAIKESGCGLLGKVADVSHVYFL